MRKNALVICSVTCVFSAFGAFARWLQGMTAFDAETGLYITGNIWGRVFFLISLVAALVLALIVYSMVARKGLASPDGLGDALGASVILFKPMYVMLSVIMAAGGVYLMISCADDPYPILQRLLAVLALLCAGGFVIFGSAVSSSGDTNTACLGISMPIALFCFWLIVGYRERASSPVVWSYAVEILALAASLVAFFYAAGYCFGKKQPGRTLFACQLGAYLCIATLPDERLMAQQVMFVAAAGMLLFLSFGVMGSLRYPDELEAERLSKEAAEQALAESLREELRQAADGLTEEPRDGDAEEE